MGRVLSIYLPEWDTQLIQRQGKSAQDDASPSNDKQQYYAKGKQTTRPILLTYTHARQELVARYCRHAYAAGVRGAMPAAEAAALCPHALVLPFDAARSQRGLERLAIWAIRFSPVVSVDHTSDDASPHTCGLQLDVTGTGHLFGGEPLMLTEIAARLRRLGFSSRLAVAPTLGAAWALARFGPHAISLVSEDQLPQSLRPLPIAALRLPHDIQMQLWQVGIDRLEHLLRIPREQLLIRFGERVLQRIDQLFGVMDERIEPIRISEPIKLRRTFDGATTQLEAILLTIQDLLATLAHELTTQESGVRRLSVELSRMGDPPVSREILLGRPCRDPKHLWSLLRPKVEGLQLGYGVEAVTLTAVWVVSIQHDQQGIWSGFDQQRNHDQSLAEFLDTLINRWGTSRVLKVSPIASHIPEEAWQFRPAFDEPPTSEGHANVIALVDRPSVMLSPPEPIEAIALQPDHAPSWLRWRGEGYRLVAGAGPERIATPEYTRDYFKVQTERGQWLWAFRHHDGSWFLHGLWA